MNKIWCLFSIDNMYDQPDNNLVSWWVEAPTLSQLKFVLGDYHEDEKIIKLALGGEYRIEGEVSYRLQQVTEGERLVSSQY